MFSLSQYLTEDKEGKNLHLEHLEDEVFNGGVKGTRGAIFFLEALRDMLAGHSTGRIVNLTTKWDGAPAVFAGINPKNGKFFVGTKGVFAQNAKLNYTPEDIDRNHPGEGLNKKLKIALQYLPELGIRGVLQGDMMFTKEDLKVEEIDGQKYITFQPNTIVYAVPKNSKLAGHISSVKMGIVWHTTYNGAKMADMKASFGADVGMLKNSKNVWFRDASFVDASGTATFTQQETDALTAILSEAGHLFRTISPRTLGMIASNDTYKMTLKAWNNSKVRAGKEIGDTSQHVAGLISSVQEKLNRAILEAKKDDTRKKREMEKRVIMDFYKSNKNELKKIFDLQNLLVRAKSMIVKKLQQVRDSIGTYLRTDANGFNVTSAEGFVAIDHIGKAEKLVDRLEFSSSKLQRNKGLVKMKIKRFKEYIAEQQLNEYSSFGGGKGKVYTSSYTTFLDVIKKFRTGEARFIIDHKDKFRFGDATQLIHWEIAVNDPAKNFREMQYDDISKEFTDNGQYAGYVSLKDKTYSVASIDGDMYNKIKSPSTKLKMLIDYLEKKGLTRLRDGDWPR